MTNLQGSAAKTSDNQVQGAAALLHHPNMSLEGHSGGALKGVSSSIERIDPT